MKQSIFLLAVVAMLGACSGSGSVKGTSELTTQMDSISYAAGSFLTGQLADLGLTVNAQELGRGMADVYAENAYLSVEECAGQLRNFQMELQKRQGAPYTDDDPAPFSTDTICYVIGSDFTTNMGDFDLTFNEGAFLQGALDATSGAESLIGGQDDELMQALSFKIQEKQMAMQAEQQAEAAKMAEVYIAEGEAFIAEKAKEEGVKSTPSGLHYKALQEGEGLSPGPTDQVTVHYEGRTIDGNVFDSSIARGEPITFGLDRVIPGWTEGLQLMKPGAKYQLYIPYDQAYGLMGSGPDIPPGATLIFDVELISVMSQQ